MKKLLLLFLAISSSAFADYKSLGFNAVGDEHFYDPDSIVRNGDILRVWYYVNLKVPVQDTKSMRALKKMDCKNRTQAILDLATYPTLDLKGRYSDSWQPEPEVEYVAPETMDELLLETVCLK